MGDFDDLYGNLDPDPDTRGRQFEHVCKWFFENDPVYSHELKTIWLWKDWPGRWGGDAGIDLVAEDRNGGLWAIQAKAYDPKYRVSKKDVDKFLAESGRKVFSYRILIATTDLIDRTGERTIQQQEKRSSFFRLNDLRAAAVDWPASPALLRPTRRRKPAKPRPHQAEAIRDVVEGFKTSDRGQLIMACGTGKTLTGLFIAEKLKAQRTLVLLPSLSLLKQTLNEWRANCTNDFASLPVCSDDTVIASDDAAIAHTADLGVPVTTDPKEIAAFLRRKSAPLVVFSTYQSSPQIEAAFKLGRVPGFDLVIADEAHRVAGPVSSDFGTVLDSKAIRADRRLFMTATPRYFTGRVLKAAQEADYEMASMDDSAKFGEVFHRLSFGEAIRRDLLTDYQVAIVGVDDATYREWAAKGALVTRDGKQVDNAATLAGQIGLAKAMRKYDLRRMISFHSRVKRAQEFAALIPNVIDWMPARQRPKGTLWSEVASGEMPAGDRYVLLQQLGRLESADRGLLANARCLSEGVDVPTLDGVAFIDPRRSEVDIVQAVGRAIRKSDNKTLGTIVIPVFIDTDEDAEVALDSSVFKPVWDVIKAMRAHDTELGEQLDELRRQMGRKGGAPRLPSKIHFDVPASVGKGFVTAFEVRLVDATTAPWEFWFGLLERYARVSNTAYVAREERFEEHRLGDWTKTQRDNRRKGKLSPDRQALLEALEGWSWDPVLEAWEDGYRRLLAYIERTGSAVVERSERDDDEYPLGQWAKAQRDLRRAGKLPRDREARLGALPGWEWEPKLAMWEEGYRRIVAYAERMGSASVERSDRDDDDYPVGEWAKQQRDFRRAGKLDANRELRLGALPGWEWDPKFGIWEQGYRKLLAHMKQTGSAAVKRDGSPLAGWVKTQRDNRRKGKLSPDRQALLEALEGWSWDPHDDAWEEKYRELLAYVNQHGDAAVKRDGSDLGAWVKKQRDRYRRGTLPADRVEKLDRLPGWVWDRRGPGGQTLPSSSR